MILNDNEHLPKIVTDTDGINDVLLAIEPEITQLRTDISDLLDELYIKTTEDFIARWEADFGLKYDASLSLEQRKQRVLNKLARKKTLTWENLRLLVKNNLAENMQFYLINNSANYNFKIMVNTTTEEVFDASKFTAVGTPSISADGIFTTTSVENNNFITFSDFTATNNLKLEIEFTMDGGFYNGFFVNVDWANLYSGLWLGEYGITWALFGANNLGYLGYIQDGHSYKMTLEWKSDNTTELKIKKDTEDTYLTSTGTWTGTLPTLFAIGGRYNNSGNVVIDLKQIHCFSNNVEIFKGTKTVPVGLSELEKAIKNAKPAYLTCDIVVTDIYRRCGTFSCGTNPL